jgi:type IV pilus assembly protein PilZ
MTSSMRQTSRAGSERRAALRVVVDLEVDYRAEENYLFASIADLSETGIFIRTTDPEPAGTELNLRFVPEAGEAPLELEGEVIWVNAYRPGAADNLHPGMGVRFLRLDTPSRNRLYELVRRIAYLSP